MRPRPFDFYEAAARYIGDHGWAVLPLPWGTKDPYAGSHGASEATTDLYVVRRWAEERPASNIGIGTGAVSGGIFALDIDPRSGGHLTMQRLVAQYGRLPEAAPVALTRSGGWHYLFSDYGAPPHWKKAFREPYYDTATGRTKTRSLGVEIKHNGGYVVAAPSWINPDAAKDGIGGHYSWLRPPVAGRPLPLVPDWLWSLLATDAPQERPIVVWQGDMSAKLDFLVQRVLAETEGNRINVIFWAGNRAAEEARVGCYSASEAFARLRDAARAVGIDSQKASDQLRFLRRMVG